jgi:hypothetical protein
VAGYKNEKKEYGVGVSEIEVMAFKVTKATGLVVAVSWPVTGIKTGPAVFAARLETICLAKATAVLFISPTDRSCVLRAWISSLEGGVGSKPASTKIIQAMPEQMTSAARACRGTANFFMND